MNKPTRIFGAALAVSVLCIPPSLAQTPVKIGLITTLSTPGGYLGQDMQDAFNLAVKEENGKLGGVPVELVIADDGLNPNTAKDIAERMQQRDKIKIFTGIIYTNITLAVVPDLLRNGAIVLSNNNGPRELDGKNCHPNFFATGWHGEAPGESAGAAALATNSKNIVGIVANYNSGLEQLGGFKRTFKLPLGDEILVKLNQTDYAAEITRIKSKQPDGGYMFLPGGMGISFLRQLQQAKVPGLREFTATTVDGRVAQTIGEAAIDVVGSTIWSPDLDNATNKRFVAAFQEAYKRPPTVYAAVGYDTARLLGSALRSVNGDASNTAGLRAALRAAKFDSVRGKFSFGKSQYPIQDWYMTEASKTSSGQVIHSVSKKLLTDFGSPYASQCTTN